MRDDGLLKELKPRPVSKVEMAFPADVRHLMPAWDDIPEEYRRMDGGPDERSRKYHRLVKDWFFFGVTDLEFDLLDGIDGDEMMAHIQTILGSFAPKHEHKEAAVAYLLSVWTRDVTWKQRTRKPTNNSKRRG